jgi:peptide/nickel transport system permease protein
MAVGVPLGLLAATLRGWTDELVGRFADLAFAFPAILSAILITALLGPGAVNAIIAIGIFNIAVFARVTRGAALQIWRRDFVRAAVALGRGPFSTALVHVLPNIAGALIVQATIAFAVAILNEAGLSYLGLGIQPPAPSWGKMLNEAQTYMLLRPTLAIFPGAAIALAVLGLNLLGDGLRDLLDPRYRRRI